MRPRKMAKGRWGADSTQAAERGCRHCKGGEEGTKIARLKQGREREIEHRRSGNKALRGGD